MSSRAAPRQPIDLAPPPVPIPSAEDGSAPLPPNTTPDVIAALNASGNVASDDGALTIIENVCDMRFPLVSWIYSITHAIPHTVYASSPHASPPSVLAYTMILFTGLLYFNDSRLRPHPSAAAQMIINDATASMFYNALLDMPVPAFAANEFTANQNYTDSLASSLTTICSLAAAHLFTDFGRLIPASTFLLLHNAMTDLPSNTTPTNLLHSFYAFIVYQINFGTPAAPDNVDITPAMLFGSCLNDIRYNNWLNARIEMLVSSLSIRSVHSGPTVGRLPFAIPARLLHTDINPYHFLSGYSPENVNSLLQVVRSLGFHAKEAFPNSLPLRNYTQPGTTEAVKHLIFTSPTPTWTSKATIAALPPKTDSRIFVPGTNPSSHDSFALAIHWLTEKLPPTDTPAANNKTRKVIRSTRPATAEPLDLTLDMVTPTPDPLPLDKIEWIVNSTKDSHAHPRCLIFDPTENNRAALARVLISGHVIEIHDLTAVATTLARPDVSLHTTNATHINGAIPMAHLRPAVNNLLPLHVQSIAAYNHLTLPQAHFRGPPGPLRAPAPAPGLVEFEELNPSSPSSLLPGAEMYHNATRPGDVLNVFGCRLGTAPSAGSPSVALWSSYRYIDPVTFQIFVLPSLRPIYGTRARHHTSEHTTILLP